MIKKIFSVLLCLIIVVPSFVVNTSAFTPSGFEVNAKAALLVSVDNGTVLYSKNADDKMYPASLTKIMTALLFIESLKDKNPETEMVTVPDEAITALLGTGSSTAQLEIGEELTAKDLLYATLICSANDGAIVMADYVSGSVDAFVKKMNEKAKELGMKNTHFCNPHGLQDTNHYTTANDMAILTKYALQYEMFADASSQTFYSFATSKKAKKSCYTTNYLITASSGYFYKKAKGVKTGSTDEAGKCLVTTALNDEKNYLCVLLNCKDDKGRYGDAQNLFDWAFNDFDYKQVVDKDDTIGELPVTLAWEIDHVSISPGSDFSTIIPKDADTSTVEVKIKPDKESVQAPVKKGDKLGNADIYYAGEKIGSVDIVASQNVERSTVLYIWQIIKDIFSSTAFKLIIVTAILLILVFIVSVIVINRGKKNKKVKPYRRK